MTDSPGAIRIDLIGPLTVRDCTGRDITPSGAKNQALLALLALTPGMSRPRRWLEDKLWQHVRPGTGQRQPAAGAGQAPQPSRRRCADALRRDRTTLWLDPARFGQDPPSPDLLQDDRASCSKGWTCATPEFEDWLRAERARCARRLEAAAPSRRRGVMIECRTDVHGGRTRTASSATSSPTRSARPWPRSARLAALGAVTPARPSGRRAI